MTDRTGVTKLAVRDQLVTARRRRPLPELVDRARNLAHHLLQAPEVRRAATVAAYVSVSTEPGTGPLLDGLAEAGKRVLLPLLQPDNDLDWAAYAGAGALRPARRGLLEPDGPPLGRDAVASADVVLVPGLAVDGSGIRLGRGGGSYDRALARVLPDAFVCVLLNSEEVLEEVPHEPHDQPVDAVATELGVTRFAGRRT